MSRRLAASRRSPTPTILYRSNTLTGRFTRSADATIGDATIVANIANADVSNALERLYSEDADWNRLLSEFSSEAIRAHRELVESCRLLDQSSKEAMTMR